MGKVYIPNIPDGQGRPQGPTMRMFDLLRLQFFTEAGFRYFLKYVIVPASDHPQVADFDAAITAGLNISIGAGVALDLNGDLFNASVATPLELAAADPANPRIDVIVAAIEPNVQSDVEVRDYKTLLTPAERLAGATPLQSPYETATTLRMRATVIVREGVPGAVPAVPALVDGDVPLWQVRVEAGAVALTVDKLTDVRNLMRHLGNPFDVAALSGLRKAIVGGRMVLNSIVASTVERGMIKVGPSFTIDPDGTLHSIFENLEALQDALATSFNGVAPMAVAYNDAANRWDFSIALATALAAGSMSAADFAKLAASTSANTASALVQRSSSGDFNGRDIKAERQFVFADNSVKSSAFRSEHRVDICNFSTPVQVGGGAAGETVVITTNPRAGGATRGPIDLFIKVEDYSNLLLCFEAFAEATGPNQGVTEIQLYNATDNVVITYLGISYLYGAIVARSVAFSFTGSGRKRLQLRHHENSAGGAGAGGISATLWRAALIVNPLFTACGHSANPACPVI